MMVQAPPTMTRCRSAVVSVIQTYKPENPPTTHRALLLLFFFTCEEVEKFLAAGSQSKESGEESTVLNALATLQQLAPKHGLKESEPPAKKKPRKPEPEQLNKKKQESKVSLFKRNAHRKGMTYVKQVEKEIQHQREQHERGINSIPKQSFARLVKETLESLQNKKKKEHLKISSEGLAVLHSAAEQLIVEVLSVYNHAAIHAKRVTVLPCDVAMVRQLAEGLGAHLRSVLAHDVEHVLQKLLAKQARAEKNKAEDVE